MKKILKKIFLILVLQVIFLIIIIMNDNIFANQSQDETDYSSVDLNMLKEIKDDPEKLSQVKSIHIKDWNIDNMPNIKKNLELIKLCHNVDYINIGVNSLELDKNFFEYINSSKEVSLYIQNGIVDFKDVQNSSVTCLGLSETKVLNIENIVNFKNLKSLSLTFVDGFNNIDYEKIECLESLYIWGQRIEDYELFFKEIKNIKYN